MSLRFACDDVIVIFCTIYHLDKITYLPFELFFFVRYSKLIRVEKIDENPYFTRSKGPKDSFSDQSLSKVKEKVVENFENTDLTKITLNEPIIAEKTSWLQNCFNKLLRSWLNLLSSEIWQMWLLLPLSYSKERKASTPFFNFKYTIQTFSKHLSATTTPKHPIIDLTTLNPHDANSSHKKLHNPEHQKS